MKAILRRYLWVGGLVLGVLLVGLGSFFVVEGLNAKHQLTATLAAEQITTSSSASIPNTLIDNAATAQSQADLITKHTLGTFGPYSKLSSTDPNRAVYLNGLTLRDALGLAVMGFGVSNLAMGAGAVIILIGLGALGLGVPMLFWAREPETADYARARARKTSPVEASTATTIASKSQA